MPTLFLSKPGNRLKSLIVIPPGPSLTFQKNERTKISNQFDESFVHAEISFFFVAVLVSVFFWHNNYKLFLGSVRSYKIVLKNFRLTMFRNFNKRIGNPCKGKRNFDLSYRPTVAERRYLKHPFWDLYRSSMDSDVSASVFSFLFSY